MCGTGICYLLKYWSILHKPNLPFYFRSQSQSPAQSDNHSYLFNLLLSVSAEMMEYSR